MIPGPVDQHTARDASSVLAAARAAQAWQREADVALVRAAADWAELHAEPVPHPHGFFLDGVEGLDHTLPLAGPGAPEVSEFALVEYAAVLGMSTDAGRGYVGDVVELAHRLPRLWGRVLAGGVAVWQARRVAQATRLLCLDGAHYVDRQVHTLAGRIGPTALLRLVGEAVTRYEPDRAEDERLDATDGRHLDVDTRAHAEGSSTVTGVVEVRGRLDAADALDLENAVARIAGDLAAAGSSESLDVRRSQALGELARRQTAFDLGGLGGVGGLAKGTATGATGAGAARQVVLHVHLAEAALARPGQVHGRVEHLPGPVALDTIAAWCTTPGTQVIVKPVIDLAEAHHVEAYEVPDRIREQVVLREHTCVFPWCQRTARRADLDHIEPYDRGGPTASHNLAPLCRRHHRVKTHGGWTYRPLDPVTDPGTYVWTSPHGDTYLRTLQGTTAT